MRKSVPPTANVSSRRREESGDSDHEQRLAAILSEVTDAVCQGESVDIAAIYQDNPDLAEELQRLLGAVLVADTAGVTCHREFAELESHAIDGQNLTLPTTIGDYHLIAELGRGGMGIVFRARQISLHREVAVKMILRGWLASEEEMERFQAEANATAKLEHPNIVPVYEVGNLDGRPFFSMQLVEGKTLAQHVGDGLMDPREAAKMVASVARTIAFAHRQGILHRDLKPSNILISESGTPMVTDFGLAKFATPSNASDGRDTPDPNSLTRSGMLLGTPAYMAPEQASGRRSIVGPPSDIYSLGCVLYFAITGSAPFVGKTPMEVIQLVIEQDPVPPRTLRRGLDRDLEMITIRCLQKPIDLRYDSADGLADDLEAYLADEQVSARSGHFSQVIARLFRETHHAEILNNWGTLWIWHSLVLLVACGLTWWLDYNDIQQRSIYVSVWTIGLGAWAAVFWRLRQRLGPVTFVERQIAHVWGASVIAIGLLFPLEWWLGLEVLTLSPMLGVISAMVFIIKAGMLSGAFYGQGAALLATSVAMAIVPDYAHLIFGIVASTCFFIPGVKYAKLARRYEFENDG